MIGRGFGGRVFSRPDSRVFRREHVDRAEKLFARDGAFAVVLGRYVDASTFKLAKAPEKATLMSPTVAAVSAVCTKDRFATFAHAWSALTNAACSFRLNGARETHGC